MQDAGPVLRLLFFRFFGMMSSTQQGIMRDRPVADIFDPGIHAQLMRNITIIAHKAFRQV